MKPERGDELSSVSVIANALRMRRVVLYNGQVTRRHFTLDLAPRGKA
jgi:hypothetical protein